MSTPYTRLETLRFVNELLCALYGVVESLSRFKGIQPLASLLMPDDIASMAGQVGLLILRIEEGKIPDFP